MTVNNRLRALQAGLALLGLGISIYLTWVHYAGETIVCVGGGGGCETVNSSSYAKLLGVPVAVYGLGGYLLLLGAALGAGELAASLSVFAALVGVGFSAYLTYLELFVIHAICQWCVASAVVMTALLVVGALRFSRTPGAGEELEPEGGGPASASEVTAPARADRLDP